MRAGVQCAKHVVGHINSRMPRTLGDGLVHIARLQLPGRAWTAAADLLRGRRLAVGMVLGTVTPSTYTASHAAAASVRPCAFRAAMRRRRAHARDPAVDPRR